jgi:hypothetical protein
MSTVTLNQFLEKALNEKTKTSGEPEKKLDEAAEWEKKAALKMKARGYKFMIKFPADMGVTNVYVLDRTKANSLLRKEFRNAKGAEVIPVAQFLGEKDDKKKVEENIEPKKLKDITVEMILQVPDSYLKDGKSKFISSLKTIINTASKLKLKAVKKVSGI